VDIVILAFLNQFPDATPGGIPGTNFGNACGSPTFVTANGQATDFLIDCPYIGPDIDYCRSKEKILLLSLGGAGGNAAQYVANDTSGVGFANFLVGAFGPPSVTPGWTGPRPFGSSYVDGYDFDVESTANQIPPGTM
jgi:chitinase